MSKRFGAGRYRQKVTIQRPTISLDEYREPTETFADLVTVHAEIVTRGGGESPQGDQLNATSAYTVSFRWLGSAYTPLPNDRLELADGTHLNIMNANNVDMKNREWVLTCGRVDQPSGL